MDWDFTKTVRSIPGGIEYAIPIILPNHTNPVVEFQTEGSFYKLAERPLVPFDGTDVSGWYSLVFAPEDTMTKGTLNVRISTDEGDNFYFSFLVSPPGVPVVITEYPDCDCFCIGPGFCVDAYFFPNIPSIPNHGYRATIIDGPPCLIGVASPIDYCFFGFGYTIEGVAWYFPAMPAGITQIQCDPNCVPSLPAPRPCIPIPNNCGTFDYVQGFPPGVQYWNAATKFEPWCALFTHQENIIYGMSLIDSQSIVQFPNPPITIPVLHGVRTWHTFSYAFIQDLIPQILSFTETPFELIVRYPCIIDFFGHENYPDDPFGSEPYPIGAGNFFRVFFITVAYTDEL
jgi:hypothetical protein